MPLTNPLSHMVFSGHGGQTAGECAVQITFSERFFRGDMQILHFKLKKGWSLFALPLEENP